MLITTWYQHLQVHIKNTTEVRKYKFSSAFRKVWKQAFNTYVYQYFGRTEYDFNSENINLQSNYRYFMDNDKSYPRPAWRPWRHSESSAWPQTSGPSHLNSKVPVRNESISQAMLLIAYGSRSISPVASSVLVVKSIQNWVNQSSHPVVAESHLWLAACWWWRASRTESINQAMLL